VAAGVDVIVDPDEAVTVIVHGGVALQDLHPS
jgi:hypothetical protein